VGDPASGASSPHTIAPVREADLEELLGLMRAYCDFYDTAPGDGALLSLARALIGEPREGVQLLARDALGRASGFATVFWCWDTTEAARIGVMNDLYVEPHSRATGIGAGLIDACRERCIAHGGVRLEWQTGPENHRAQALYDRVGGVREPWIVYTMPTVAG
jgi:GNAT superfamily N-acetyltransferase